MKRKSSIFTLAVVVCLLSIPVLTLSQSLTEEYNDRPIVNGDDYVLHYDEPLIDNTGSDQYQCDMALANEKIAVTWADNSGGVTKIWLQLFDLDMQALADPIRLDDGQSSTNYYWPKIVATKDGAILVVWISQIGDSDDRVMYAQWLDNNGKVGDIFSINYTYIWQTRGQDIFDVAINEQGNAVIAWGNGNYKVFCNQYTKFSTTPLGQTINVYTYGFDQGEPMKVKTSINANNEFMIAWEDDSPVALDEIEKSKSTIDHTNDIWVKVEYVLARGYNWDGSPACPAFQVNQNSSELDRGVLKQLITVSNNQFEIYFRDKPLDGKDYDTRRRYNVDGTETTNNLVIPDWGDIYYSDSFIEDNFLIPSESGKIYMAWHDNRTSPEGSYQKNMYGRVLYPNRLASPTYIISHSAADRQTGGAMVVHNRKLYTIWNDDREDGKHYGVWYSIIDADFDFYSIENPPQLVSPSPQKKGTDKDVWLQWQEVPNADYYEVQVDDDMDFSSPSVHFANTTRNIKLAEDLDYEQQYYWRVRANFTNRWGDWSTVQHFVTMTPPPVHINAPDRYSLEYIRPEDSYYNDRLMQVTNIPENLLNCLWVKTDNDDKTSNSTDLVSLTIDDSATIYVGYDIRANSVPNWLKNNFTSTQQVIETTDKASPLQLWKKSMAKGDLVLGGNLAPGADGARSNYVVLVDIPIKPLDPVADKVGTGAKTVVSWTTKGNYNTYDIQADSLPDFSSPVIEATDVSFNHYMLTDLVPEQTYFWRVRAHNRSDDDAWTTPQSFTTMSTPLIEIQEPANYVLAKLDTGDQYYTDRNYTITQIPQAFENLLWLKTANDDADLENEYLVQYELYSQGTVYIGFDSRMTAIPTWASSSMTAIGSAISVSDHDLEFNLWQMDQAPGTYTLGANAAPGAENAQSNYIVMFDIDPLAGPVAAFEASPVSGTAPLQVTFTDQSTGNITSRTWDFGDDSTSTLQNPTHTYETAGTFSVTLVVTGPAGADTTILEDYITVTAPAPISGFTAEPLSGTAPLEVRFTNTSTGEITQYIWNFGDGEASEEENPVYTYQQAGVYSPMLVAYGPGGADSLVMVDYITVSDTEPVANFTADTTQGIRPVTIHFMDKSAGEISSWEWDFGDGATSTEASPAHTYDSADTFDVSLIVTGPGGTSTLSREKYITVLEAPPIAGFGMDIDQGPYPLTVQFSDSSQGVITDWLWDFGDGSSSSEQHPSHVYETADSFNVSLKVTGPGGTDTIMLEKCITVSIPTGVSDLYNSSIPTIFSLDQNYPNPFNPVTTIRYALPQAGHVTLSLYNVLGKLEKVLVDQHMNAGNYKITFDASHLSSGVYFYRIQTTNFADTKKMTLLK